MRTSFKAEVDPVVMAVKLWMVFEAVGAEKNAVEESIEEHIDMMETEEAITVEKVEKDEVEDMEDPAENLEEGFSQVLEVEVEFDSFPKAVETVINYGPTYVQFQGPDNYEMDMRESQDTLQTVANMMHKYAQMGAGGVLISKSSEQEE